MSGLLAFSSPNPFVSSSRTPRNLREPLLFSEDYGLLTSWYHFHRTAGSTTIQKVQLRKEHVAPFHEFVIVVTKAGYIYRVDRGREGPVLDTLREQGVPPVDTIAILDLPSLEQLDRISYCAIDLCWGARANKTIDLKLVLEVCFQIHNNSGKRYKLLTHNCYFFAQTIVTITLRKTVACKLDGVLKDMSNSDMLWGITRSAAMTVISQRILELQQLYFGQKVQSQLGVQPNVKNIQMGQRRAWWKRLQKLGPKREQQRDRNWEREINLKWELQLQLGRDQEHETELKWELQLQLERDLELAELGRERVRVQVRERARVLMRERVRKRVRALKQALQRAHERGGRPLELKLALALEWEQERQSRQELEEEMRQELERELRQELERKLKRDRTLEIEQQELVHELVHELAELGWARVQVWQRQRVLQLVQVRKRVWSLVRSLLQAQERGELSLGLSHELERQWELERELAQKLARSLAQELVQELAWERMAWEPAQERVRVQELVQEGLGGLWKGAVKELGQQLGVELGKQLRIILGEQLGRRLGGQLGERLGEWLGERLGNHLGEELEPQLVLCLMILQLHQHELQQRPGQQLERFRSLCKLECDQELVMSQTALGEVLQRGLTGDLETDWHRRCSEITVAARADAPGHSGLWAKWLIGNLGKIVIHALQQEPLLGCSYSGLFEFPGSFSVSSKINAKAPKVAIEKPKDLEEFMQGIIEQHLESVPPTLGSREELRAEILNGMTATWHLVSPQFQYSW